MLCFSATQKLGCFVLCLDAALGTSTDIKEQVQNYVLVTSSLLFWPGPQARILARNHTLSLDLENMKLLTQGDGRVAAHFLPFLPPFFPLSFFLILSLKIINSKKEKKFP